MADVAERTRDSGLVPLIKKRWRAWLRAFHRDFGYLAIGFTVIYAISGIAQNHIEDWGEVSYKTFEATKTIEPISDDATDEAAFAKIGALVDFGKPTATFRAGDEVRLEYGNGSKVTAIGSEVTIQGRERRAFIGAANWLHTARNKKGWKYVADVYAVLLLYLAISGIFMIKGKLGLKGRGALLISLGVAVPVAAVMFSSPSATKADATETAPAEDAGSGIEFLPTEEPAAADAPAPASAEVPPTEAGSAESGSAKPTCDPFGAMHGCD